MVSFAQATPTASSRAERPGSFSGSPRAKFAPLPYARANAGPRRRGISLFSFGIPVSQKKTRRNLGLTGLRRVKLFSTEAILSRQRPQKRWLALRAEGRSGPPQPIALRLPVKVGMPNAIRMARSDVFRQGAIRRRGLRKPRRITDRAEIHGGRVNVIADRLQPLQDRLPLFPIQLPQERPQSLDERILQQCFAIRFRDEEPVQPDVQRFRDLLQRAEAGRHLPAFDPREIRARDFRARLQLALGHRARFAQLADSLPDVLHRLLVDELLRNGLICRFLLRRRRRNHEFQALRQRAHAPPAVSCARPVLYQSTRLAADHFPVHLERGHLVFVQLCRHRCSLLTFFSGVRIGEERRNVLRGKAAYWRDASIVRMAFSCQEYFCTFFRVAPVLIPLYAPFSLVFRPVFRSFRALFRESLYAYRSAPIQLVVPFLCVSRTAGPQIPTFLPCGIPVSTEFGATGRRSSLAHHASLPLSYFFTWFSHRLLPR